MLKQGLFMNFTGDIFSVFELEVNRFYRLDICKQGAQFHNEPEKVLYSIVKKGKKTFIIGDRLIFSEMEDHKNKVKFSKLQTTTEPNWIDGVYYRKQFRGNPDDTTLFSEIVEKAGKIYSETYRDGVRLFQMTTIDEHTSLILNPFNLKDYEVIEIGSGEFIQKSPYVSLPILKTRFNLSHLERRDYKVVTDIEEARRFLKVVEDTNDLNGIDTETDSLDFNAYSDGHLVGVILSPEDDVARYFPFAHTTFKNLPIEFLDEIEAVCLRVAEKLELRDKAMSQTGMLVASGVAVGSDGSTKFYGSGAHNKKFERKVFMKVGKDRAERLGYKCNGETLDGRPTYDPPWFDIPIKHDSMEASVVANPVVQRGAHALKNLAEEATGDKFLEFSDIFLDSSNINFADLDEDLVKYYACPDADNLRKVLRQEWGRLPVDSRYIYELECKLADLKAEQEYWGWRIDSKKFVEGYNNTAKTVRSLEEIIHILARWPDLKITSGEQLSELLYGKLKCTVYVRTKQDKPSTGAKALKKLATEKRDIPLTIAKTDICDATNEPIIKADALNTARYPIVLVIERYKEYIKLLTGFYHRIEKNAIGYFEKSDDGVISLVGENLPCLRYFFWINQNGTVTGRQSSPMHQLPKKIKEVCLPDSSDHKMCGTDYSQIELRIFFSMGGEEEFIVLCQDPKNDIHRIIDSIISKREMWEISQSMRSKGKQRNFGVVYLMSDGGLAVQKYGARPTKAQIRECKESIDDLFHNFKRAHKFIMQNRKDVLKYGYMRTLFGRYAYFDKIFDPDLPKDKRESLIRRANNMPVQGTAADIMKIAEVNIFEYIKKKGWDKLVDTPEGKYPLVRAMISAHDEVVVSYHKSIPEEEILKMKRECMEMTVEGWAPLFGSSSIIENWLQGKKDSYAVPIELRDKLIAEYEKTGVRRFQSEDPVNEMVSVINEYRDTEVVAYMEGLIERYGDDAQTVANNVRHPSITHELVARFPQTEEHRHEHGVLTHVESILYACERYFEFRKSGKFEMPSVEVSDERLEESHMQNVMEEITGISEELSYLDNEGNVVFVDREFGDAEEDRDSLMYEDEESFISEITGGEKILVWEMFNMFIVDFEGLTVKDCDEGLKLIHAMSKPDGFSVITVMYGGKSIDTGMRADKLDMDAISNFIRSKVSVESFVAGPV